MKKFKLNILLLLVAVLLSTIGCGAEKTRIASPNKVTGSGSSALLPLLKAGQEEFYKQHSTITINLSAGGSFTGQNQVASGVVDIGSSDVGLQGSLQDKGIIEHKIAGIPFVIIVNKSVGIDNLSQQQCIDIFTGKITNWQQVGGNDQRITIISRALSSGTRITITEVALNGQPIANYAIIQDSNGAVRSTVETTPGSISYIDAAYINDTIKVLAYDGVKFSVENVAEGKYPLYTYGRMFTKGEPQGATKEFIDFLLSDKFQSQFVEQHGFIPLAKLQNFKLNDM